MNMKKIVLVMSLLMVSVFTFGQTAKSVLDKTAAVVSNKNGVQANFTMTGGMGDVSGTIAVKGRKFHATTPIATMWFDGKTMWTYMKKNEEVNITTPNEAQLQKINPYNFINLYKQGYDMTMSKSDKTYTVHLTAKNSNKIQELFITVDKNTYHPTQVKMLQGKKWTVFDISNLKAQTLSDAIFTFNSKDFPSAEVIDLR
jgi:outer membrane lipoprotein-sorting protein